MVFWDFTKYINQSSERNGRHSITQRPIMLSWTICNLYGSDSFASDNLLNPDLDQQDPDSWSFAFWYVVLASPVGL